MATDYDLEDKLVLQKLKEAQALRQADIGPQGTYKGHMYIPDYAPMFQGVMDRISGNRQQDEATNRMRDLSSQQDAEIQDYVTQMKTPGTVLQKTLRQGEGPLLQPNFDETQRPMTPVEQNQREMGLSMDAASRLPKARAMATQFINSGVGYPERVADREAAQQAAAAQQAERLQAQKEMAAERAAAVEREKERDRALRLTIAGMSHAQGNTNADLDRQIKEQRLEQMKRGSAAEQKDQISQKNRQKMLDEAMTNIDIITAKGGPLEKSTGSGIGRLADTAAGFFGYGTEGAKNAASLEPLANPILMQVPRFEGPQSDKDTAVYKAAAGQLADTSLPVSVRMAAAKTIKEIMVRRKGQFGLKTDVGDVAPAAPSSSGAVDFGSLK